jgi:DNA-directed RNA polymerase subunit RPC12/RpoP
MVVILMKCPSCGKRFEVRRTGEELMSSEKEVILVQRPQGSMVQEMPRTAFSAGPLPDAEISPPPEIEEEVAEKDIIEDRYTCKHCGHTWVETREVFKEKGREVRGRIISEGAP